MQQRLHPRQGGGEGLVDLEEDRRQQPLSGGGFALEAPQDAVVEHALVGDVLIDLGSTGLHSNGYSLVRHIMFEEHHYQLEGIVEGFEDLGPIGNELLNPTKIYAKTVASILAAPMVLTGTGACWIG